MRGKVSVWVVLVVCSILLFGGRSKAGSTKRVEISVASLMPGFPTPVHPLSIQVVYMDSSPNQYTFWTQVSDPVFFGENGQYVLLSARTFPLPGSNDPHALSVVASQDGGANFLVIHGIDLGYNPSATIQAGFPVFSYTKIGGLTACITLDWSGQWSGEETPNEGAHRALPLPLPDNQHVLVLISSATSGLMYGIYDAIQGSFELLPTVLDPAFDLTGVDILGDIAAVFGFNANGELAYYLYDAANNSWSGPTPLHQVPVETLPNGEVLGAYDWADGILLNDGTPMMVVGMADISGMDTVAADRTIWAVTPDTAVQILGAQSTDPAWHHAYVQLAIDRSSGIAYVFWNQLDTWYGDTLHGYGTWDIWVSTSADGGHTWTDPQNLTATPGVNEGMFQVAKRVVNGRAWMAYLRAMGSIDGDLYSDIITGVPFGGVHPVYIYLGYVDVVGLSGPPPFSTPSLQAQIVGQTLRLTLPTASPIQVTLYDVTGRRLYRTTYSFARGTHEIPLPTQSLRSGLYFVSIQTQGTAATLKLVRP